MTPTPKPWQLQTPYYSLVHQCHSHFQWCRKEIIIEGSDSKTQGVSSALGLWIAPGILWLGTFLLMRWWHQLTVGWWLVDSGAMLTITTIHHHYMNEAISLQCGYSSGIYSDIKSSSIALSWCIWLSLCLYRSLWGYNTIIKK